MTATRHLIMALVLSTLFGVSHGSDDPSEATAEKKSVKGITDGGRIGVACRSVRIQFVGRVTARRPDGRSVPPPNVVFEELRDGDSPKSLNIQLTLDGRFDAEIDGWADEFRIGETTHASSAKAVIRVSAPDCHERVLQVEPGGRRHNIVLQCAR